MTTLMEPVESGGMTPWIFELVILGRMHRGYRASVLERMGKEQAWLDEMLALSGSSLPYFQGGTVARHLQLYGAACKEEVIQTAFDGRYLRHEFRFGLWPEMVWAMHSVDGLVYGCTFNRRESPGNEADGFRMADARAGKACLGDFEALGAILEPVDGWGESVLMRIRSGGEERLGIFVFGLFQGWHLGDEFYPWE